MDSTWSTQLPPWGADPKQMPSDSKSFSDRIGPFSQKFIQSSSYVLDQTSPALSVNYNFPNNVNSYTYRANQATSISHETAEPLNYVPSPSDSWNPNAQQNSYSTFNIQHDQTPFTDFRSNNTTAGMNIRTTRASSITSDSSSGSSKMSKKSSVSSQSSPRRKTGTPSNKPSKRSRMGCLTCRQRKKRCCESRPKCTECGRLGLSCVWPAPGMEHKNRPKNSKLGDNLIHHDVYGSIKILRGIVEYKVNS